METTSATIIANSVHIHGYDVAVGHDGEFIFLPGRPLCWRLPPAGPSCSRTAMSRTRPLEMPLTIPKLASLALFYRLGETG